MKASLKAILIGAVLAVIAGASVLATREPSVQTVVSPAASPVLGATVVPTLNPVPMPMMTPAQRAALDAQPTVTFAETYGFPDPPIPDDPTYTLPPPEFPGCKKPDSRGFIGCDDIYNTIPGSVTVTSPPNSAPVCSAAVPNLIKLWPPNHQLVPVSISGVTDPEGGLVTISIVEVTQDEPVQGLGSGDTFPDALVVNPNVQLRAERAGKGNGRVYRITFRATDVLGAECRGTLNVGVPKSNDGATAVENPFRIISTR
jgi:hypothetical protein